MSLQIVTEAAARDFEARINGPTGYPAIDALGTGLANSPP
jgi:hypothetical protein